jgi:uncharacterized membrane protein (UPF0127 family)
MSGLKLTVAFAAMLASGVLCCGTGDGGEVAEPSPTATQSVKKPTVVPVVLVGPEAALIRVKVEVARTQSERSRGLMFREPSPTATQPVKKPTVVPVVLVGPEAALIRVKVEVARTQSERSRGLMFRKALPSGSGMVFVFDREEEQRFWMKNTLIPLDMIFIGIDKRIVGIVHEATPQTLTQRTVGKPSLYVLEVPGGWSRSHGLAAGQRVRFEGID